MRLLSSFLVLALSTSAALAGDVGPLSPGAPAGVKNAQLSQSTLIFGALAAAAAAGFVVALTSGSKTVPVTPGPVNTSVASTV